MEILCNVWISSRIFTSEGGCVETRHWMRAGIAVEGTDIVSWGYCATKCVTQLAGYPCLIVIGLILNVHVKRKTWWGIPVAATCFISAETIRSY